MDPPKIINESSKPKRTKRTTSYARY